MRYALYFTPGPDNPLTLAGASWLGRDAFTGRLLPAVRLGGLSASERSRFVAVPGRYGFHATLVAPFRLKPGFTEGDVLEAADLLAAACMPFMIPRLAVSRLSSFLALMPAAPNTDVSGLASVAVDHFDALRAPPTDSEILRRNPERLSDRQRGYLGRYGYPYVKDEFRFHMTLTGPVTAIEASRIEAALEPVLAPVLAAPVQVDTVSIFVEPEPGAPFTVRSTHRLGRAEARRRA